MRYREVIIDGRVFLEIVDDEPEPATEGDRGPEAEEERPGRDDDRGRGVWIGELVPH